MSYAPLRSNTSGVKPSASSMHEGQLFVNVPDETLFIKSGTSVIPVAGKELTQSVSSGNDSTTILHNGLKITHGSVDLTFLSGDIVYSEVTFPVAFDSIPTVTMSVNSDQTTNEPTSPPTNFSTRVDTSTSQCTLIAYRLNNDYWEDGYTLRAYYQAIGF